MPHPTRGFTREARLVRRTEFETVYRSGRRYSSAQFLLFCVANGGVRSRFGISVKRGLGGAVVRNRIRRRVREILRRRYAEIPSGWDIVIHPRSSVAWTKFALLEAELLHLLEGLSK